MEFIQEARREMLHQGHGISNLDEIFNTYDDVSTEDRLKEVEEEIASYTKKLKEHEEGIKTATHAIKQLNNQKLALEMKLQDEKRNNKKQSRKTSTGNSNKHYNEILGKDYGPRRQDWEYGDELNDMIEYFENKLRGTVDYVSKYQKGKATQGPRNYKKANIQTLKTAIAANAKSVTLWSA